ncbi:hypothetical protein AMATHDRAFT_45196 [Amanita thiersii Skay4041]|uniref:Pali-domain-containing protein n=1 Tax=Amanita thiersii Skay4041 TaxID=703135 RepID=A0A2A9NT51_9AGAR|nr:hypothetical protein AMATHDRAFT_45196 [Amanita thiersii Skay4041]
MAAGPAIPGAFLCFAAAVLLIFVSVSPPTWDSISFLDVTQRNGNEVHYGVFGYTGSKTTIGYQFNVPGFNMEDSRLSSDVILNLTKTLILHPIAAGLSGLAFFFGLCGLSYHRSGTVFMALLSGLAALTTLVAWVLDMTLFSIARNQFRDQGFSAQYGNALWITLGALVALLVGFCAATIGIFGRYRKRREAF